MIRVDIEGKIICWWSGGITSAVACKITIDLYGKDRCVVVMIDTKNEDEDTYRFKQDCEKWYGLPIKRISGIWEPEDTDCEWIDLGYKPKDIEDVWDKHTSLNVAHGAICSSELKRKVREKWQAKNPFSYQVFGFEFDKKEMNRALGLAKNHSSCKPIFPLLMLGYNKKDCLEIVEQAGITVPRAYTMGYHNNNCLLKKCIQGGVGYWQKVEREDKESFDRMAAKEHELTDKKGRPVTMLKDQSNAAKATVKETGLTWKSFVFLKKHPDYPEIKCLADMPPCKVEPLMECNGFCGTNDLTKRSETEKQINFDDTII